MTFALAGAKGTPTVSGGTATYAEALPGVSVAYTAEGDQVKEALTLASPAAASAFSFDVATSSGVAARKNAAGGIDFLDSQGRRKFSFAPPFMADSSRTEGGFSRALSFDLVRAETGLSLTLAADPAWLRDPRRVYPVEIDPSLTMMGAWRDCFLASATPTKQLLHARQRPRRRGRRRRRAPGAARLRHRELRRAP